MRGHIRARKPNGTIEYDATVDARVTLSERALDLRLDGMSEKQIGDIIGYSRGTVRKLLDEALARHEEVSMEYAAKVRKMELERLDKIYLKHSKFLHDEKSANICLRVQERRARLLGIDAPQAIVFPRPVVPKQHDLSKLDVKQLRQLRGILAETVVGERPAEVDARVVAVLPAPEGRQ